MQKPWLLALAPLFVACGEEAPVDFGSSAAGLATVVEASAADVSPVHPADVAEAAHARGDYREAAQGYLALSLRYPLARALAARSMMEEGRLSEAYALAVQVTRELPEEPLGHFVLGLVAQRHGRTAESKEAFQRVIDLDPGNAAAHNNLGTAHYVEGDFTRARYATEDALHLSQDDEGRSIAEANLGELAALTGRMDEAEAHEDKALELAPETAHPYFQLAVLYDVTGRPEASRHMAELGVSLDPLGVSRRLMSFAWPELELHQDALVAEARGDVKTARRLWTQLAGLQGSQPGGMKWSPLNGRAAAHLAALAQFDGVAPSIGGSSGGNAPTMQTPRGLGTADVASHVTAETHLIDTKIETYEGYRNFEQSQPEPPHKCD